MLDRARSTAAWSARESPLELVLSPERALDPSGAPEQAHALVAALAEVGATTVNLRFVSHSAAHYREQLEAMVALARELPSRP
jgi:hypothetical protein